MDLIQTPLAISHYSSKTCGEGGARKNKTLFELTSTVHYQSGEDVVVILRHHPHRLGLKGHRDKEREGEMNRDRTEKMVTWSRQVILESTARKRRY